MCLAYSIIGDKLLLNFGSKFQRPFIISNRMSEIPNWLDILMLDTKFPKFL